MSVVNRVPFVLGISVFSFVLFQGCSSVKFGHLGEGGTPVVDLGRPDDDVIDPSGLDRPGEGDKVHTPVDDTLCDPFNANETACSVGRTGLVGRLYYQPPSLPDSDYNVESGLDGEWKINDYLTRGVDVGEIVLSRLFLPTQSQYRGFEKSNGDFVRRKPEHQPTSRPDAPLKNFFAVSVEGALGLTPADAEGEYEIALLADDGVILEISENAMEPYRPIIDADRGHSTSLHCATRRLVFDRSTTKTIRLRYFNNSSELALVLLYRKVTPSTTAEPFCGDWDQAMRGDFSTQALRRYFGAPPESNPIKTHEEYCAMPNTRYGKLCERGWAPLTPSHFKTIR